MVAFILAHERNRALRFVGAWSDNSLRFDFAFVRLCDPNGGTAVEIARGSAWHLVAGFPFGAKDVERVVKLRTIEFRFAADSPLEEAVSSEPVSKAKFPASWENTGNFVRLGLRVRLLARNR
jgi:hypothetical protein